MAHAPTNLFLPRDPLSSTAKTSAADNDPAWKYLAKTYFNESEQFAPAPVTADRKENHYKNLPGAIPISMNQMLKAQNSNAPWLINVLKKKFQRSRTAKKERLTSKAADESNRTDNASAEDILQRPISVDGTSGKWIVHEDDVILPLMKVGGCVRVSATALD